MKLAGQLSNSVNNSSSLKCETIDSIGVRKYIKIEVALFPFSICAWRRKELISMRGNWCMRFFFFSYAWFDISRSCVGEVSGRLEEGRIKWTNFRAWKINYDLNRRTIKKKKQRLHQPQTRATTLWPPEAKSRLAGKDPMLGKTEGRSTLWPPEAKSRLAGKDWGQGEKGTAEGEMAGWYRWRNRCEFEQALGDGDGQGSLACCSPWSRKESDATEQLNDNS